MVEKWKGSVITLVVLSVVGLVSLVSGSAYATPPPGTISYWGLDETTTFDPAVAVTYTDSVGTNDGDSTGSDPTESPVPAAGRVGVGQTFGSDTGINVPADDSFDFLATDSFSIECWMRGTAATTQVFIGRDDPGLDLQWWVGTFAPGVAAFNLSKGGVDVFLEGTIPLDNTKFYHIVAVRDGSANENRLYVDGVLDDTESATYADGFASLADLNIGWINRSHGYHFQGTLDEVALYDKALSASEILEHYQAGLAGKGIDPPPPPATTVPDSTISYWKLDETTTFDPAVAVTYTDSVGTNDGDSTGSDPTESPVPAAGRVGVGQTFGSDTGINVPADDSFDFLATDSFSIECWMRGTAATTQVFIGRDDPGLDLQWWVGTFAPGVAAFNLSKGGVDVFLEGTIPLDNTKFYHIVAVRDGSANENRLYVDGVLDDTESATYADGFASLADLNIGWINRSHGYHFQGTLDEVALYDKALSASEILEHYQAGLAGKGIDTLVPKPGPVADAGPDQAVIEGDLVTLDGSNSSDSDGTIDAYLWEQEAGTPVTLSDETSEKPTFVVPDVGSKGDTLTFKLTVTDNDGLEDDDTVQIDIVVPPKADAGPDQVVDENDTVTLDGSNSLDTDGVIVSHSWQQTDGTQVQLSDATSATPKFTAPDVGSKGDILRFVLTVTDDANLQTTDAVRVEIRDLDSDDGDDGGGGGGGGGGCFISTAKASGPVQSHTVVLSLIAILSLLVFLDLNVMLIDRKSR